MSKWKNLGIRRICILAGVCLLVAAAATLILWEWNITASQKRAESHVATLYTLMPPTQAAVPEERRDNTMSVLSIEGTDYVGILEFPSYGSVLPICADWGKTAKQPCRFSGSIYDRSLKIGATTQAGQYDFYRELSLGDRVLFTDMEGNRYTLQVTALRNEKHADQAALQREDAALTLFIKNIYAFEYLIVFCDVVY